jgi:septal ring factor EnvC (AmiA/AmiB activator)
MAGNTGTSTTQDIKLENDANKVNKSKVKTKSGNKKSKLKSVLIILLVMFVLAAIFFVIGRFNILNLGNAMSKIPGIGTIVSTNTKNSNKISKTSSSNINVNKLSKEKLKAELKNQIKLNSELQKQKNSLLTTNSKYKDRIAKDNSELKDYNALKNSYKKLMQQNADAQQTMYTSKTKSIAAKQKALEANLKTMAAYYTKMEPEVAANALVKMYAKNKTLTVEILSRINNSNLADIFASIDSDTVQKMTQDLYIAGVKKVNSNY